MTSKKREKVSPEDGREKSKHPTSNHDALVVLLLKKIGPLSDLKKEVLKLTGKRSIQRTTIERAVKTAIRYLLDNEIYCPLIDAWTADSNAIEQTLEELKSPEEVEEKNANTQEEESQEDQEAVTEWFIPEEGKD